MTMRSFLAHALNLPACILSQPAKCGSSADQRRNSRDRDLRAPGRIAREGEAREAAALHRPGRQFGNGGQADADNHRPNASVAGVSALAKVRALPPAVRAERDRPRRAGEPVPLLSVRAQARSHKKLCGSTSTATLTPPRGGGAAASSARRKPCRSAERGALAARRKRWRLRRTAIGASAGPSSVISSSCGCAAERRDAPALSRRHRMRGPRERAGVRLRRALVLGRDDDRGEPAERRQAADPPLLGLLRVKALGVAGDQRPDHRMVRLPGLQQGVAFALRPPRPPGRLAQELEGALRRARIGVGEADVGVDHADEGQQRKVVALGHELRADDEIEFAALRRRRAGGAGSRSRRESRTTARACARRERAAPPLPPGARRPARRRSGCRRRGIPGRVFGRGSTWPQ